VGRTARCAADRDGAEKAGVLSFVLDEVHPHDIGTILDQQALQYAQGTTARNR